MGKQYTGDRNMQKSAKANDNAERQKQIQAQVNAAKHKIEHFHFGEQGGRENALNAMKANADKQQQEENKQQIKQQFNKNISRGR